MFGICVLRNTDYHFQIVSDVVDNFHRHTDLICGNVFPFCVKRHIPKICRRLHFQIFCTFAHTLPLSLRKKNVLAFCSFRDYHSPYLLSIFGVLGAEALNKPTAKQVGKKVYFFCTCANLPVPLCKHRSGNAFTSCRTVPMRLSEQFLYLHYPQKQQTAYQVFPQKYRMQIPYR